MKLNQKLLEIFGFTPDRAEYQAMGRARGREVGGRHKEIQTEPMLCSVRAYNYAKQTGSLEFTPTQRRRMRHKVNRHGEKIV